MGTRRGRWEYSMRRRRRSGSCGRRLKFTVSQPPRGFMQDSHATSASAKPAVAGPNEMRQAYFTVGATKFSLMSLTTFGIYALYWFYRNWRIIRDRDQSQISPFWRAFFAPFWTFSMGSRFTEEAKGQNISLGLPVIALGVIYLLLNALWRLPDPYGLVTLLAFIPLLPFDFAARRLNGGGQLAEPDFARFSGWNIAWLIVGSLLLVLGIIGAFIPEDAA
jgi:hypothetical protein